MFVALCCCRFFSLTINNIANKMRCEEGGKDLVKDYSLTGNFHFYSISILFQDSV